MPSLSYNLFLQRKLRTFEKKQDQTHKSLDDTVDADLSIELNLRKTKSSCSDDESLKTMTMVSTESTTNTGTKTTPQATPENTSAIEDKLNKEAMNDRPDANEPDEQQIQAALNSVSNIYVHESGLMMLPETHPEFSNLLRLQLENMELAHWKTQLQARINSERAEIVRLKDVVRQSNSKQRQSLPNNGAVPAAGFEDIDYTRIIAHYLKENSLLEQKRNLLTCEIFDENKELIQLQVDLAMKKFKV